MGMNNLGRKKKFKRSPSLHQKQMRFWTISLVILGAVAFGVVFYFLNKYGNRTAL